MKDKLGRSFVTMTGCSCKIFIVLWTCWFKIRKLVLWVKVERQSSLFGIDQTLRVRYGSSHSEYDSAVNCVESKEKNRG